MTLTNPNRPEARFASEGQSKRRTVLAVGVVAALAVALVVGYLVTVGGDWRGALHLADAATDEAAITASIESSFALSDEISADAIDVATQGGVVRLRGTVSSEEVKQMAVEIARNTEGVDRVEDQLLVETTESTDNIDQQRSNDERSNQ